MTEELRFAFVFFDKDNCEIPEAGIEVMARSLGHALQKIAALEPENAVAVTSYLLPRKP